MVKLLRICTFTALVYSSAYLAACAPMVLGTAAAGVSLAKDRRSAGTILDDHTLDVRATVALMNNKELWKESHLTVVSYNNSVLIVGQTPKSDYRTEINRILREIPEIDAIYNQVTIEEPISFTARTTDSWITTQVKTKIISAKEIGLNKIKVLTENKIVYLIGLVSKSEEQLAIDLAREISAVEKVVSLLEIV